MEAGYITVTPLRVVEVLVMALCVSLSVLYTYGWAVDHQSGLVLLSLATDVVGITLAAIIFGAMAMGSRISTRDEYIMGLFVISALAMYFDCSVWFMDGTSDAVHFLYVGRYIMNFFLLLSGILTLKFFRIDKDLDPVMNRNSDILAGILTILALLMIATNWYTGWIFSIDDHGFYHRGSYMFVYYLLNFLLYGIVLENMIRYYANLRDMAVGIVTLVVCSVMVSFQYVFWGFTLICLCPLIVLMIIYVYFYITRGNAVALRESSIEAGKRRDVMEQIHPAFLSSSLEYIAGMEGNTEEVAKVIEMFRTYLDENMRSNRDRHLVPFSSEASHVELYLRLEKLRFKDKLEYEFDLSDSAFNIPPLALQLIVENAVRHGVTMKPEGGRVCVSSRSVRGGHKVVVEDNGTGFDTSILIGKDRCCGGILLTSNTLHNDLGGKLKVKSRRGKGTRVEMFIPD